MQTHDDDGLRSRFAAMRREDVAATPQFEAGTRARPSRRSSRVRPALGLAAAAVALVFLSREVHESPHHAGTLDPGSAEWHAGTDFLLRTPGAELLSAMPSFNAALAVFPSVEPTTMNRRTP